MHLEPLAIMDADFQGVPTTLTLFGTCSKSGSTRSSTFREIVGTSVDFTIPIPPDRARRTCVRPAFSGRIHFYLILRSLAFHHGKRTISIRNNAFS